MGFAKTRQAFHSRLDVAGFDERPFTHQLTQNEAKGIQFTTLTALGDTPENRRLLYKLNKPVQQTFWGAAWLWHSSCSSFALPVRMVQKVSAPSTMQSSF